MGFILSIFCLYIASSYRKENGKPFDEAGTLGWSIVIIIMYSFFALPLMFALEIKGWFAIFNAASCGIGYFITLIGSIFILRKK